MMGQDCITPKNEGKYNKCHMLNQNVNSLFFLENYIDLSLNVTLFK